MSRDRRANVLREPLGWAGYDVNEICMSRVDAVYVQSPRKVLSTSSADTDTDAARDRASRGIARSFHASDNSRL